MSRQQQLLSEEVAYSHYKQNNRKAAIVCIQTWWRLVRMRTRHTLDAKTIVNAGKHKCKYLRLLQAGYRLKDRGFHGQMDAFQSCLTQEFHKITTKLQPILHVQVQVRPKQTTAMLQAQYVIMHQAKALIRPFCVRKGKPHISILHRYQPSVPLERCISYSEAVFTDPDEVGKKERKTRKRYLWGLLKGTEPTPTISWADISHPAFS